MQVGDEASGTSAFRVTASSLARRLAGAIWEKTLQAMRSFAAVDSARDVGMVVAILFTSLDLVAARDAALVGLAETRAEEAPDPAEAELFLTIDRARAPAACCSASTRRPVNRVGRDRC